MANNPTMIGRTMDLGAKLQEAGLLPPFCVRFIIDSGDSVRELMKRIGEELKKQGTTA